MSEKKRLNECSTEELRNELIKRLRAEHVGCDEDGSTGSEEDSEEEKEEPTCLYFDEACSFVSFPVACREPQIMECIGNLLRNTPSDSWVLEVEPAENSQANSPHHVRLVEKCIESLKQAPIYWNCVEKLKLKCFNLTDSDVMYKLLYSDTTLSSITFENCAMRDLHSESYYVDGKKSNVENLVFWDICAEGGCWIQTSCCLFDCMYALRSLESLVLNVRNADGQDLPDEVGRFFDHHERLSSFKTNFSLSFDRLSAELAGNRSLETLECVYHHDENDLKPLADVLENHNEVLSEVQLKSPDGTVLPWETYKDGNRVLYYTLLNRHGRKKLQDSSAWKSELVRFLHNIQVDKDPLVKNNDAIKVSVSFGLLSLDPTVWIGATVPLQSSTIL